MNNLRNKVTLIGRLGKDVDAKHLDGGKTVARLSLATTFSFKNQKGDWTNGTDWHNLVIWGKQAETAEKYLKKGSEIAIEGRLTTNSWEDKDGNKRYSTEVIVNEFLMLGSKKETAEAPF